jgi:hypothetical protein
MMHKKLLTLYYPHRCQAFRPFLALLCLSRTSSVGALLFSVLSL